MRVIILLIKVLLCSGFLSAQLPYTSVLYDYDSIPNIPYGTASNYNGDDVTLLMDIYKPRGDVNCKRPAVVLVHGGAWIAGSKTDANIIYMAREFARRGWVVASINYRLGMHNTANYNMYAFCNNQISAPCGYVADSAEVYRAIYRAMQDAKGAVRFLKARHAVDSTDVDNFFIAGESAGGFVSLAAALLVEEEQKPIQAFQLNDAPVPSPNLAPFGCIPQNLNRSRPDLGSEQGNLHVNTAYDASVQGVGNFYGGLLDLNLLNLPGPKPVVYGYHQGSDVIVHWRYGRLLGRISFECYGPLNICQPYPNMPFAHGNDAIRQYVEQMQNPPQHHFDIVSNFNFMNDCGANGHSINNRPQRVQNMIDLFANRISQNGNTPTSACLSTQLQETVHKTEIKLFPIPAKDKLNLEIQGNFKDMATIHIYSVQGRILKSVQVYQANSIISIQELPAGIYILSCDEFSIRRRFVKSE
jgi:hypothetical protein